MPDHQPVYLIDGSRTPFSCKLRRDSHGETVFTAQDLVHITARAVLSRQPITAHDIDDVIMASSNEIDCTQLAECAAQRLQCKPESDTHTFIGSEKVGIQALSCAYQAIATQDKSLVLLGAVESVNAPIISMSDELSEWLQAWKGAAGATEKTKVFNTLHTRYFRQRAQAINEPEQLFTRHLKLAESVASQHSISLEAQAEYVNLSQRRLKYAQRNKTLCSIAPVYYPDGTSRSSDENLITLDPETLKHAFQTSPAAIGLITLSSVAQATEGACCLLLASKDFVEQHKLVPLAELSAPMSSAKKQSVETLLESYELTSEDVDYWEWDETSAAEVLALKQKLIYQVLNSFDCVNLDGGALALGSPSAASNLRNILQLSHRLKQNSGHYGICHFDFFEAKDSAILVKRAHGFSA